MFRPSKRWHIRTKTTITALVILTLLLSLPSGTTSVLAQGESKNLNYSIKTTITYVNPNEGTKTWNLTEEDRASGLFMNNAWQSAELKETTFPVKSFEKDEDGNGVAVLEFPKQQLPPGENLSFTAEHSVVSKPRAIPDISEDKSGALDDIPPDLKKNYTSAEGPWTVNDPKLAKLAHEVGRDETNVLKLVRVFVAWIRDNIHYTTHEFPLYPNETLDELQGDCDDQAILLVTLSRIMGIPSHVEIGAIYLPDGMVEESLWENHVRTVQKKIGWHGWAMLYIPPWGWLPVDLTYITNIFDDPLDAIRYGAVVKQNTVQYMNYSKVDYVAVSRQARTYLLENDFVVEMEDEMRELEQNNAVTMFNPTVVVVLVLTIVVILAGSFLTVGRWRKHPREEEVASPLSYRLQK